MSGLLSATDVASITATIASSFDQSLPLYRKSATSGTYGENTAAYPGSPTSTVSCTIQKPTSTVLENFADIIGSKTAFSLRCLNTTDIREGDRIVLNSVNYLVQNVDKSDSYTYTYDALITAVV